MSAPVKIELTIEESAALLKRLYGRPLTVEEFDEADRAQRKIEKALRVERGMEAAA